MKMLRNLFVVTLLAAIVSPSVAEERTVTELSQIEWMVGTWSVPDEPLEEEIEGVASKGDVGHVIITTRYAFGKNLILQDGVLHVNGKQHPVFHAVWGIDPATNTVRRWAFMENGVPFEGYAVQNGDKIVVHIQAEFLPVTEEQIKQFGPDKFHGSGELSFQQKSPDEVVVVVDNVRVNGKPFPWPNQGKPIVKRRVESKPKLN